MHLLVFSPYYPPHHGGLETHSDEFNKYLSLAGTNITVLTPRLPRNAPEREILHTNVTVIRFPAIELIHNYPLPQFWNKDFWIIWREVRLLQPDIILSRTRFFFPSLMAGYFAWKKNIHWVHIEHGSDFAQFGSPLKNFIGRVYDHTFGNIILKNADTLVGNSEASKKFVCTLSGRHDCHVIHRGIEKVLIESATLQMKIREDNPTKVIIGYIGRLIAGKGVEDLIRAFANSETHSSLLIIIGDGPEQTKLENLCRELSLEHHVLFLGAQPHTIAMGHLKTWDIFVNPSYTEGIPTSVIEAALLGKAIIATDVGGTNEIISGFNDGFLVAPHDIKSITESLVLLQENETLRQDFGKQAKMQVEKLFTWEGAIKKYQALFSSLLEKK